VRAYNSEEGSFVRNYRILQLLAQAVTSLQQRMKNIYSLIIAFAFFMLLSGCTIVGFTTGAIIDANQPDTLRLVNGDVFNPYDNLSDAEITLKNGEKYRGTYLGYTLTEEQAYQKKYEGVTIENTPLEKILPFNKPLTEQQTKYYPGRRFRGFLYTGFLVENRLIPFHINAIDIDSGRIASALLQKKIFEGIVPTREVYKLMQEGEDKKRIFDVAMVRDISAKASNYRKWIYGGIGLGIDALIFGWFVSRLNSKSFGG
jgi:hypothetical protein